MTISFIHCGDIHLGFNQYNNEERFHDFHRSFAYIVDYAIENKVDYLLIAGDFFNKRSINSSTLSQAVTELQKLKDKNIKVIATEGNHDKAPYGDGDSWMRFLNGQGYFHLLSPRFEEGRFVLEKYEEKEGSHISFPGVRFIGLGYQGSMTARRVAELNEQLEKSDDYTVLMLHSAVDRLMHLGGIKYEDIALLKDKVDHVAMGHIHHRYELEDWIYNPGSPECWDVGEGASDKEKGFYHVVLEGSEKKVSHIPSSKRPTYTSSIDVSDCEDLEAVYSLCEEEVRKLEPKENSKPIVQLVIKGSTSFSPLAIDIKLVEEKILAIVDCLIVEVVNKAIMKRDQAELTGDPSEMNREELERQVLEKIFTDKGDLNPWVDDLVDISKKAKELIHQGEGDKSISNLIEGLAAQIVEEEIKAEAEQREEVAATQEATETTETNEERGGE